MLISLYFGYGCVAFHDLNSSDVQSYIDYIQISYHMSKILGKFLPCHTPLCKILTDVFGRMEISLSTYEMYNKGRNLSPKERAELIKFDRRLSERMNESCKFFEYGVFIYDNESSSHQDACKRQRSRCRALLSKGNSSLPMNTLVPFGDCNRHFRRKID
ncbi:hypothetical protein FSP39_011411 [Pinctada imbricata]|uniref:Uncharacterized protein n=1 Tax=Pinctada imbricata TaxID=66713 RepID=A0AA88YME3_PINIB|nr:hypothetical protein FSP39_011411 [Pinctada imbricata]